MARFQTLLLCIAIAIGSNWAKIPYNEININIFNQDDWSMEFSKTIANETMGTITESEILWMKSTLETIQPKMKLLRDDNFENRRTVASLIHTDLNKMIDFFECKSSPFRKYPLLGAPPLIQLASLVATFGTIADTSGPKKIQLSCKMHNVLTDYLRRITVSRMHKLIAEKPVFLQNIFQSIVDVTSMPFNERGYNKTNPGVIDCEKGDKDRTEIITDTYGPSTYYVGDTSTCIFDYVALMRHRIEKLFPIEKLNKLCVNRAGYGWLRIHLLNAYAYGEESGKPCKFVKFSCDPYVILYIDKKAVLKTKTKRDTFISDIDETFISEKILKTSTIEIEVWDASSGFWESDALIMRNRSDVDSFLNEPLRTGVYANGGVNAIETMSFWTDD